MLLDFLNHDLLHLSGSDVLGALHSLVELLTLGVSLDCFIEETNSFVDLSCTLILVDSDEALTEHLCDFVDTVFSVGHSQVEAVIPDLFKLISVLEVLLCDLEVSSDSLLVVAVVFPVLGRLEDFTSGLGGNSGSTRVVFIDLVDKVGCMFIGDTESFTVHTSFLVHVNSFLGLLCVDEALLSLAEITTLKLEFSLVQENFSDGLGMVLSSDLES